ncbi:MAG: Coenzyme F420 hydrogenase/dehydrogenase, beta subunit C-terminal domain [Methanomicrobia archaeon]|nr:Coenzyme F420 hydrogenase/dehydrogenase, beta subunit C-terminal domain [Methanomicrobia archaeon]
MAREANPGEASAKIQDYVRLPTFLECGFGNLTNDVTAKRICCLCGTCAAFCDKIAITGDETGKKEPRFVEDYDTVCGLCYTFCPRTFLPLAEIEWRLFGETRAAGDDGEVLGVYRSGFSARATKADTLNEGQDGGVVTSLLAYALDEGIIDCSVITTADEQWRPMTKLARTHEDLKAGAGTKYTLHPGVTGVRDAIKAGCEKIGFVGLPCQMQGLRKVQTAEQPYDVGVNKVKLSIGLFCMENFTEALLAFVARKCASGSLEGVNKFNIKGKELLITEEETFSIPLEDIERYIGEGCLVCMDYTAELADISVGSVGSEDGWSTVFARTAQGEELVKAAAEKDYIELKELDEKGVGSLTKLAKRKKENGMKRSA